MSAELLREAAALMRERAEAAPAGPWVVYENWTHRCVKTEAIGGKGGRPWRQVGQATEALPEFADHAASWHPAVALAVADWLEVTARDVGTSSLAYHAAVDVARAYLGRPS